jgi:1-acyl-sn-glycerol-3-phosphate acyltransferase
MEQAGRLSMLIREHMLVHWDLARASTGHELPGPLPADEVEPDPATGVTEQGAS